MSDRDRADTEVMVDWADVPMIETHVFKTNLRIPLRLRFKEWRRRRRMSARAREIEDEIGRRVTSAFLHGEEYDRLDRLRDDALDYARDDARDRMAEAEYERQLNEEDE